MWLCLGHDPRLPLRSITTPILLHLTGIRHVRQRLRRLARAPADLRSQRHRHDECAIRRLIPCGHGRLRCHADRDMLGQHEPGGAPKEGRRHRMADRLRQHRWHRRYLRLFRPGCVVITRRRTRLRDRLRHLSRLCGDERRGVRGLFLGVLAAESETESIRTIRVLGRV